jgi:hypothetical protein
LSAIRAAGDEMLAVSSPGDRIQFAVVDADARLEVTSLPRRLVVFSNLPIAFAASFLLASFAFTAKPRRVTAHTHRHHNLRRLLVTLK